jgi:guanylate kinase
MKKLIILHARTAAGKTTVEEGLNSMPETESLITVATRDPRLNEVHGVHYYFMKPIPFSENIDDMAAWIQIGENTNWRYGVPKSEFDRITGTGVFSAISAAYVKDLADYAESIGVEVVIIYINVSKEVRSERLSLRGESKESIAGRFDFEDKYSTEELLEMFPGLIVINGEQYPEKVLNDVLQETIVPDMNSKLQSIKKELEKTKGGS